MAIIFSQSKAYRNLSVFDLTSLTEEEARLKLKELRWGPGENTQCPSCEKNDKHYFIKTRKQWTCRYRKHRFSVTSTTPFSSHKISLVKILFLVYSFISSPQGLSSNQFHSQIGASLKTIFLNFGKIREAIFETMLQSQMTGVVHVDCAHFCGKPRRANVRKKTDSYVLNNKLRNRKDGIVPDKSTHPEHWNVKKLEKRRIVLALSQCDTTEFDSTGSNRTLSFIINRESAKSILPIINKYIDKRALIMTDSGGAFKPIFSELGITHLAVNHSERYSDNGVNNNMAESFFSRIRRAEFGTYNGMRPQYLAFYSAEFSWRNDSKKLSLGEKLVDIFKRIFSREPSKAFTNYGRGHRLGFEYIDD